MNKISVFSLLKESYALLVSHIREIYRIAIPLAMIALVLDFASEKMKSPLFSALTFFILLTSGMYAMKLLLNFVRHRSTALSWDMIHVIQLSRVLIAYLYIILITLFAVLLPGLLLFVLVGSDYIVEFARSYAGYIASFYIAYIVFISIISVRLHYVYLIIVDRSDCSAVEAIQKSWEITQGNIMTLFVYYSVYSLAILASILTLGLGFILVIPLFYILNVKMYLLMSGEHTHIEHHKHG